MWAIMYDDRNVARGTIATSITGDRPSRIMRGCDHALHRTPVSYRTQEHTVNTYDHLSPAQLIDALVHAPRRERFLVAEALGQQKVAEAADALIAALDDSDEVLRREAAWALGELADPRAVETLIVHLADSWMEVADYAGVALSAIGAPAAAPLIAALASDNSEVRWRAAAALGRIGDPAALPALEWMRQHDEADTSFDGYNRDVAADAIARITGTRRVDDIA